jgi:drug/metabolite transporter (DMT)-like permease
VLTATLLALGAAGLHAAWNLIVKLSDDRWIALWAMSLVAGALTGTALVVAVAVGAGPPGRPLVWAGVSGVVQLGYLVVLARAYDRGDFSVSYPVARGGGAVLAAIGGVVLLGDELSALSVTGIGVAAIGLGILVIGQRRVDLAPALVVAALIATYTLVDAHGSRESGSAAYPLVVFVAIAVTTSVWGLARGQAGDVVVAIRHRPSTYLVAGAASALAYVMVVVAVRSAPVGHVTALRESSVVIAAVIGWRYLGEGDGRRRLASAAVVLVGLVLLVAGR